MTTSRLIDQLAGPGETFTNPYTGPMIGYYAGICLHRVAGSEWRAGFRVCERCPDPWAAPDPIPGLPSPPEGWLLHKVMLTEHYGDVLAIGHVGALRMVAAVNDHARWAQSHPRRRVTRAAGPTLWPALSRLRYLWMVNPDPRTWSPIRCDPATPGAFPVTMSINPEPAR